MLLTLAGLTEGWEASNSSLSSHSIQGTRSERGGFHMTERLDVGELPDDSHARLIHLTNAFGRVLFDSARAPSLKRVGSLPEPIQRKRRNIRWRNLRGATGPRWRDTAHRKRGVGNQVRADRTPSR
jgi:hypothetical protein